MPVGIDRAWAFFTNPDNLKQLTPDGIGFNTISAFHGNTIYAGQVIEYKIRPVWNIPFYWMTEITQVNEPDHFFVDEQRFGPFALWHHQHHFVIIEGGVEMTDIVHYKLPLWFLGDLANILVVRKRLKKIFDFRFGKTEELFGRF